MEAFSELDEDEKMDSVRFMSDKMEIDPHWNELALVLLDFSICIKHRCISLHFSNAKCSAFELLMKEECVTRAHATRYVLVRLLLYTFHEKQIPRREFCRVGVFS